MSLYTIDNEMYSMLLRKLEEREFYWSVPNDDNRAADGKYLRIEFQDEIGDGSYFKNIDAPCTVLEMMIGVAERMDDVLYDSECGPRIDVWFWEIIENLGLSKSTDLEISEHGDFGNQYIDSAITQLLERTFGRNGVGSMFPIYKNVSKNQRTSEIWDEMNDYITENFQIV